MQSENCYLDFERYTVAWIAPLEIEAQAARCMLDNVHKGKFKSKRGDGFLYTGGDINGHNVVIASFPADYAYGTISAAALASDVKEKFPHLWFGLLVGIAAGLPDLSSNPPLDIRLGDVLVATSVGDNPAIVNYEFGKETHDGFQLSPSGILPKTEQILRAAIGKIRREASESTFAQYYQTIVKENKVFCDPGQAEDRLHQANNCVFTREPRLESSRFTVWYGTIGSGQKLIKDSQKRDALRRTYNIIGIEMEAAGIMNILPVAVIRGVSDYGDAHKNDEWQSYAAITAAAYAKGVLYEIRSHNLSGGSVAAQSNLSLSSLETFSSSSVPLVGTASVIQTHDSFASWLESFRPGEEDISAHDSMLAKLRQRKRREIFKEAQEKAESVSSTLPREITEIQPPDTVRLMFRGLRKNGDCRDHVEILQTSLNCPIYQLIHHLHAKGYEGICGFRADNDNAQTGPLRPLAQIQSVVVSAGPSRYDISQGLQINMDERLIDFYDMFLHDGCQTGSAADSMNELHLCSNELEFQGTLGSFNLRMMRSLRVPEVTLFTPRRRKRHAAKPPATQSTFPLFRAEDYLEYLPRQMRGKGGVFFPMFQREALAIEFDCSGPTEDQHAVRVFAGAVNVLTGEDPSENEGRNKDDFFSIPRLNRLSGFRKDGKTVKQFVAMPLGFGYTAEEQMLNNAFIGGIQLEIAPRLASNATFRALTDGDKVENDGKATFKWLDLFHTPRQLGLQDGKLIFMNDFEDNGERRETYRSDENISLELGIRAKSAKVKVDANVLRSLEDEDIYPRPYSVNIGKVGSIQDRPGLSCPTLLHNLVRNVHKAAVEDTTNKACLIDVTRPLTLTIDFTSIDKKGEIVSAAYSPYMDISSFKWSLFRKIRWIMESDGGKLKYFINFNGETHEGFPEMYTPLHLFISDGGIVSFSTKILEEQRFGAGTSSGGSILKPSKESPMLDGWQMGLASGAELSQAILKPVLDHSTWAWHRALTVNCQILNSVAFESITGIRPPPAPTSINGYTPVGTHPLNNLMPAPLYDDKLQRLFRSVGQVDLLKGPELSAIIKRADKIIVCVCCERNLCDTFLLPCKHMFCLRCITLEMTASGSLECMLCEQKAETIETFSAPMEVPSMFEVEYGSQIQNEYLPNSVMDEKLEEGTISHRAPGSTISPSSGYDQPDSEPTNSASGSHLGHYGSSRGLELLEQELVHSIEPEKWSRVNRMPTQPAFDTSFSFLVRIKGAVQQRILQAALMKAVTVSPVYYLDRLLFLSQRVQDLSSDFTIVPELFDAARVGTILDRLILWVEDSGLTLPEVGVTALTGTQDKESWEKKMVIFLDKGCDAHARDKFGRTMLHVTHRAEIYERVKGGAPGFPVDVADSDGRSPLHTQVENFNETFLRILLEQPSAVRALDWKDKYGLTAYHYALFKPIYIRKRLADAGADVTIPIPAAAKEFRERLHKHLENRAKDAIRWGKDEVEKLLAAA
ncbi:hypothetical protein GJ744_006447 [Endocarpon pusillum]|uniref:RING-type domain-containing protein n=1 Tax=Endocarpon pusillum TaxID=364733 RepID=A0A8H7A7V7_9EURO|nr:hypothetical protein GJ744_006447 [Endocarpon pusillum]